MPCGLVVVLGVCFESPFHITERVSNMFLSGSYTINEENNCSRKEAVE